MPEKQINRADLMVQGRVAGVDLDLLGTLEDGRLGEITGCARIDKSLTDILDKLDGNFKDATNLLKQIAGDKDAVFRLDSIAFGYRNTDPGFVQLIVTMTVVGNVFRFAILKMKGRDFVVGLDLKWEPSMFGGNILSGLVGAIALKDLGVYWSSNRFENLKFDPARDFRDIDALNLSVPAVKGRSFNKGLNLSAKISVGSLNLLDFLGGSDDAPAGPPKPAETTPAAKPDEAQLKTMPTRWVKVDKAIGPFFVKRIGFEYDAPEVMIKMDGGVNLSCVVLTLLGFGISYPLNKITTDIKEILKALRFHLDGASLALDVGPVGIAGGLLKVSDDPLQLDGTLMLRVGSFTLGAIGSYADLHGTPSLFIFAAFQQILGGPPYFVVAGLAFGFGINRALEIPPMDQVGSFPLVKAATDPFYLGTKLDLRDVSDKLGKYVYPSPGNFWMAAGLKFISFGLINGFVMATVSVGIQFQVALLGLAKVQVPPQAPGAPEVEPIASVELAIKVCLSLSSGVLAVEGQLTENSFILSRQCRLTGGFAFNCWFCPAHLGDFVVSLGGYHPRFVPPAHYPVVPRLGLQWSVSKYLSITGGIYFALTPSCCMAGGKLDAVFQMGGLRAWFYAYADFLISWKPFYYDVAIGIGIGVSYTLRLLGISKTFGIELSATLHLWGPPFGGTAHVTWWVISFDIDFGDQKKTAPGPIDWQEFHQSFLPQPDNAANAATPPDPVINKVRIASGLIREQEKEGGDPFKVVNAHTFSFVTEAAVPCTGLQFNQRPVTPVHAPDASQLGIKPMGVGHLNSQHKVTVEKQGKHGDGWDDHLEPAATAQGMPHALWSSELGQPKQPSAKRIANVPNGMTVTLRHRQPNHALTFIDLKKFRYEIIAKTIDWAAVAIPGQIPAPGDTKLNVFSKTVWDNPDVNAKRDAILATLEQQDMQLHQVALPELAAHAAETFQTMPAMAVPGESL